MTTKAKTRVAILGASGRATLISATDNLTKGASGQGVQNFNLMYGYPETTGVDMLPLLP